jgi:hypothetical protein
MLLDDADNGMVYLLKSEPLTRQLTTNNKVTRRGSKLYLNDVEFRFSGPNVFWLGLDYDEFNRPSYPNQRRIEEAFQLAAGMNARCIVRAKDEMNGKKYVRSCPATKVVQDKIGNINCPLSNSIPPNIPALV